MSNYKNIFKKYNKEKEKEDFKRKEENELTDYEISLIRYDPGGDIVYRNLSTHAILKILINRKWKFNNHKYDQITDLENLVYRYENDYIHFAVEIIYDTRQLNKRDEVPFKGVNHDIAYAKNFMPSKEFLSLKQKQNAQTNFQNQPEV
ncbi:MAG: hypothetical protein K6F08_03415 [bacterium]|nr:hypothetical protein [bacterium]